MATNSIIIKYREKSNGRPVVELNCYKYSYVEESVKTGCSDNQNASIMTIIFILVLGGAHLYNTVIRILGKTTEGYIMIKQFLPSKDQCQWEFMPLQKTTHKGSLQ